MVKLIVYGLCTRAATIVMKPRLERVLRAPVRFFNATEVTIGIGAFSGTTGGFERLATGDIPRTQARRTAERPCIALLEMLGV